MLQSYKELKCDCIIRMLQFLFYFVLFSSNWVFWLILANTLIILKVSECLQVKRYLHCCSFLLYLSLSLTHTLSLPPQLKCSCLNIFYNCNLQWIRGCVCVSVCSKKVLEWCAPTCEENSTFFYLSCLFLLLLLLLHYVFSAAHFESPQFPPTGKCHVKW